MAWIRGVLKVTDRQVVGWMNYDIMVVQFVVILVNLKNDTTISAQKQKCYEEEIK